MPFEKVDVPTLIHQQLSADPGLKEMWDTSRMEYKVLGELVKIRKAQGLSQQDLAERSNNKQQIISRIENRENSPTLKTICSILDAVGYEIQLVPSVAN